MSFNVKSRSQAAREFVENLRGNFTSTDVAEQMGEDYGFISALLSKMREDGKVKIVSTGVGRGGKRVCHTYSVAPAAKQVKQVRTAARSNPLKDVSTDDLLAELGRRVSR